MRIRETQAYGEGNEDIGYSLTMEFDPIGSRRNMQRRKYLERIVTCGTHQGVRRVNLSFKTLPVIFTFLLFIAAASVDSAAAEEQNARPNILFIVADDLGYGEIGCYGGKEIPTPHIDTLAAGGARFTSGYVTAPFCAASRAALMTGRYQTRFGFEFNPIGAKNAAPGVGLPLEEKTIGQRLRDSGYAIRFASHPASVR